jgi:hypothetical protein
MSKITNGVLAGVDALIDSHFFSGDQYRDFRHDHKRSCIELSKNPPNSFDGAGLVASIYKRIEENLSARPARPPSSENWKLRNTKILDDIKPADHNSSDEVTLERAIIQRWPDSWTYQMPIAAGLFDNGTDRRRAIDLIFQRGNDQYDFVELKLKSDTPLYAAMEILGYGLVYLASREDSANNLSYVRGASRPVLAATAINLVVLAPSNYYEERYSLQWLELGLRDGLKKLIKDKGVNHLTMDFQFERFPDEFVWSRRLTPADLPPELPRNSVYP